MKKLVKIMITALCMVAFSVIPALACTSYYVGSECTADGTTFYGRTEDNSTAWDKVFKVIPAKNVGANAKYVDESGDTTFTGPIKLSKTLRYSINRDCEGVHDGYFGEVGQNELGVSMSATTSASPSETLIAADPFGDAYDGGCALTEENLADYVLCQATSAKDAVQIIIDCVESQSAGEGNGLFVADKNEVWYVEILSGHNVCAIKMPSDKAAIIPNCFMIGNVDVTDTENVMASKNLIETAKEAGTFVDVDGSTEPEANTASADKEEALEDNTAEATVEETAAEETAADASSEESAEATEEDAVDTAVEAAETAEAVSEEATAEETADTAAADAEPVEDPADEEGTTINVKLSYAGAGYKASNGDRIRGGQWMLTDGKINNEAIYEDDYQDMFFDAKDITVEKMYKMAGTCYEEMQESGAWGDRKVTRVIGIERQSEAHIFQINKDMPAEIATVQWQCQSSCPYNVFVPFYTAIMTETPEIYSMESFKHNTAAAYWVYRDLGTYGAASKDKIGAQLKTYWGTYMKLMQKKQAHMNAQMLGIYKYDKENLEYYGTALGKAIGEQTYDYALEVLNYTVKMMDKADGNTASLNYFLTNAPSNPRQEKCEVDPKFSSLNYDLEMIPEPVKAASKIEKTHITKTVCKSGKKLAVTASKAKGSSGYQFKVSTNANFTKSSTKTKTVKNTNATFTKLKVGKKYYAKVRAYKTVDGKKVYGNWSWIKVSKTIKK